MMNIRKEICAVTGLSPLVVDRIANDGPYSYKVFYIPKRKGGHREIAQPSAELKMVQRALGEILLDKLPVHTSAYAYIKGKNIRDNAFVHAGHTPILKKDFKEFFPSIKDKDWITYCKTQVSYLDEDDILYTTNILFRKKRGQGERSLRLSIGAPTSPQLSNILLYNFDELISEQLKPHLVRYSRYADDMTFSAPRTGHLNEVEKILKKTIKSITSPSLTINEEKTVRTTTRYGRYVTGLTLSNDGKVGLGRKKQDLIRARMHKACFDKLTTADLESLSGELSYVNSVDPEFFQKLIRKYGEKNVYRILRIKPQRRYNANNLQP